ncbi:MAG: hypothetical protein E7425_04875 [Ruminococcaceae bacterium]|nr:hypothetical protein [Oscillospiraceae bacterium]
MADWQEQLHTILSDPDAMAQIVSLAQSISGGDDGPGGAPPPPGAPSEPPKPPPPPGASPEAVQAMLGSLDPELAERMLSLLSQLNRPESGETTALLLALRPFLSEKRRGKVERAAQLAWLIHLGKQFLTAHGQEGERV